MDTLPDRDFADIFHRITEYIDVAGCETPEDIEYEMIKAIRYMKRLRSKAKKPSTIKKWSTKIKRFYILGRDGVPAKSKKLKGKTRVGFATRVMEYAMMRPRSRISLTLQYGKEKAEKIFRKRLLKRLRTLARKKK